MYLASEIGSVDIVKVLLSAGAQVDQATVSAYMPILFNSSFWSDEKSYSESGKCSCKFSSSSVPRLEVQSCAVPCSTVVSWQTDGYTPLQVACLRGHANVVPALLDHHAAVTPVS